MSLDEERMPGSADSPRLPDESMEYLREFSDAPGVAEGGGERNHYCMQCHGVIPLRYDSRESSDRVDSRRCPHCGVELEGNVRMMFNWVEMDQVPESDLRALLPWAIAGVLFLGALGFLLWWIFGGSSGWFAGADEKGPSVLLITIDTCRADHLSGYGYSSPTTPELDRLAARGRRFERAYSTSSSTSPSHASIFTGRYPSWHSVGVTNGLFELNPSELTLAEIVAERGWRTGAVISNPVLRASVGFAQGFDTYDEEFEGVELNRGLPERYADQAVDLALHWLEAVRGRRFFFWLHLQDPHGPYSPPEDWPCEVTAAAEDAAVLPVGRDQSGFRAIPRYQLIGEDRSLAEYRRRYDCEIAFTDHHLGRLFDFLESDASFAETLIVLTADHGEAFGEDGFYFAHGHSIGLDQVHVPLILAGPGIPPGETISTPVSNVAVFATVLDYLGLEPTGFADAPSLLGEPTGEPVFVESPTQVGIVTDGAFVRRDRLAPIEGSRPPGAKKALGRFWRAGAEQVVPRSDLDPQTLADSIERAKGLLAEHDQRAHGTYPDLGRLRKKIVFTSSELETLRKLGYVE